MLTLFALFALQAIRVAAGGSAEIDMSIRSNPFDSILGIRAPEVAHVAKGPKRSMTLKQTTRKDILHRQVLREASKTHGAIRPRNSPNTYPDANPMPLSENAWSLYPDRFANFDVNSGVAGPYGNPTDCIRYCEDYSTRIDKTKTCIAAVIFNEDTCKPVFSLSNPGQDGGTQYVTLVKDSCADNKNKPDITYLDSYCTNVNPGTLPPTSGYSYTGQMQTFTAPYLGLYSVVAYGATGGGVSANPSLSGGLASGVTVDYYLQPGQAVSVVVGGKGGTGMGPRAAGGGGGGTFLYTGTTAIAVGGGGGGAAYRSGEAANVNGPDGIQGYGSGPGSAGSGATGSGGGGGTPPTSDFSGGGGGAGWNTDGGTGVNSAGNTDIIAKGGMSSSGAWAGGKGGSINDGQATSTGGDGGYGGGGAGSVFASTPVKGTGAGGGGGGYGGGGGGGLVFFADVGGDAAGGGGVYSNPAGVQQSITRYGGDDGFATFSLKW